MEWLYKLIANSSDAALLVGGVVCTAALALVLALISRRLLFSPHDEAFESHSKLADVVHGSLLAFSVFVLALVLTEVRSNLGKADDSELREASVIARLVRDLQTLGTEEASIANERVKDYVRSAVSAEWEMLAQHNPSLAEETDRALASLVAQVNKVAADNPDSRQRLTSLPGQAGRTAPEPSRVGHEECASGVLVGDGRLRRRRNDHERAP